MKIVVALDKTAVKGKQGGYVWVDGAAKEEFFIDDETAEALERDGFLTDMWDRFDAVFDWGDCDFFPPEKCQKMQTWLLGRLDKNLPMNVRNVYENLLDYSKKAVLAGTGIYFDF